MQGSAFGQDQFVIEVLNGQRGGYFLDSGASNGVRGSNTLVLETQYGWQGICVEPNKDFFEGLTRNRNCHCVNCCLYDHDGDVDFVEAGVLSGILDEYDPRLLSLAKGAYGIAEDSNGRPQTTLKQARTVRSVLDEFDAPRVIDYWSLDTEGSELAILRSFPFDRYRVRVLTVEHNNWHPARNDICAFLETKGFRRVRTLIVDDAYVHRDLVRLTPMRVHSWRSGVWSRIHR